MKNKKVIQKKEPKRLSSISKVVSSFYKKLFKKVKPKPTLDDQITDHNWWEWV